MKLPSQKRIFQTDFEPDYRDFVEALSIPLNGNFEPLFQALVKGLSIADNILGTDTTITVELDSSGIPKTPSNFKLDFTGRVRNLIIGKVENLTNSSTYPTGAPFITFSQTDNVVTVKHIAGLAANNKYRINLIALG